MALHRLRHALLVALLAPALAAAGCGKDDDSQSGEGPAIGIDSTEEDAAQELGFPAFATANTTRVAGSDSPAIAAAVARAVYPAVTDGTRPEAVTLVDGEDWRTALAASALMADPIGAPVLLSEGSSSPAATTDALEELSPTGSEPAGGAQVIRVGDVPRPARLKTTDISGADPFALARQIDAFASAARGRSGDRVLIVSADEPAFAMPAAGWAAKSGDPILFVRRNSVPAATRAALATRRRPRIYVLGPSSVISPKVTKVLRERGEVIRIGGKDPVTNAVEFARYQDATFGWGVIDPGHGLVFANTRRPADAAAASALSARGTYGPLLLLPKADSVPEPLENYLLDIQPGFSDDPVRGVYNHGWLIGDEERLTVETQARLDEVLRIVPVSTEPEPEEDDAEEPSRTTTTPSRTTTTPRTSTGAPRTTPAPTTTPRTTTGTRTAPAPTRTTQQRTTTNRSAP